MVEQTEALLVYKKIVEWAVPILLLALCRYLASIAVSLSGIKESLSIVTTETRNNKEKLAEHSERISKLEDRI